MKFPVVYAIVVAVHSLKTNLDLPVESIFEQENPVSGLPDIRKRSYTTGIVAAGLRAMNKLLKDAHELPAIDMTYRDFLKLGGRKRALQDFNSVTKPVKVKEGSDLMSAEVGDRIILLRSHGETGHPELEILRLKTGTSETERQFSGDRIYRIIYKD